jgi:hypothetical protein
MYKRTTSLLAFLLCFVASQGQIGFRFGPSVGIGVWGLGASDSFTDSYQSWEYQQGPGWSGNFGMSGRWTFGRHWQLQHGLDYQFTETGRKGYNSQNYATPYPSAYRFDEADQLHLAVLPVTWGLVVGKGKVRASFNVGARLGFAFAGIRKLNREYTSWPQGTDQPDPEHGNFHFLEGYAKSRWVIQGLGSFQLDFADRVALSLNLAVHPGNGGASNPLFAPAKTMAYMGISYRPFGKELKAAPDNAHHATTFETGPEIGYSFPLQVTALEETSTSYSSTTIREKARFTPLLGWKFRFGLQRHLFVDLGLQLQTVGVRYELFEVSPGSWFDSYYRELGSVRVVKLCLPVALGYRWEMGNFQPFAALGFRGNFLARRLHQYDYQQYSIPAVTNPQEDTYRWNRFFLDFEERFLGQVMANVGTGIGKHLGVGLTYAFGRGDVNAHATEADPQFNHDLFLTFGWRFGHGARLGN